MIDFSKVKSIQIPEGNVKQISANGFVLWKKPPLYTDLIPTAIGFDGNILDGVGYRRGAVLSGSSYISVSAITSTGMMEFGDGTKSHDIYVYGLNLTGSQNCRYGVYTSTLSQADLTLNLGEGTGLNLIQSVTKLADGYFKITTNAYSNRIFYFALCGAAISGVTPIVTLNQPIF